MKIRLSILAIMLGLAACGGTTATTVLEAAGAAGVSGLNFDVHQEPG